MNKPRVSVLAYEKHADSKDNIINALAPSSKISFLRDQKSFSREVNKKKYDVIFINISAGNGATFDLIKQTKTKSPNTPIIITSITEKAELIVKALRSGAYDFIAAPFSPTRIQLVVQQAMEYRDLKNEINYHRGKQDIIYDFDHIVAESPNFKAIIQSLKKFSQTDSTILITGKTGTGKSFLSGTIHFNSHRKKHPFITINCANIPASLLESELFGHEKGSFTGADKQRIGRFEQAEGGTIFLDEIGEIPLEIQAKLLRVIEDKSFERVGGNKTIKVDVRVIAATNKDLPQQVIDGLFREDLYYRINVLPVSLPDLSERPLCLAPLAQRLLAKSASSMQRTINGFSPEAIALLKQYNWPGNIRQLANTIERAIILEEGDAIQARSIQLPGLNVSPQNHAILNGDSLENHEKELILKALEEELWVQKNAAKKLGISPRALNYKIKKFGITHPNWRKHRTS